MPSRTFTLDELEALGVAWGSSKVVVHNESVDSGRWSEYFETVFRADDKLYFINTAQGLTEIQEDGMSSEDRYPDMEYETKSVECPEVELYEELVPMKKFRVIA